MLGKHECTTYIFTPLKENRGKQQGNKKMSHTFMCAGKRVHIHPCDSQLGTVFTNRNDTNTKYEDASMDEWGHKIHPHRYRCPVLPFHCIQVEKW